MARLCLRWGVGGRKAPCCMEEPDIEAVEGESLNGPASFTTTGERDTRYQLCEPHSSDALCAPFRKEGLKKKQGAF